ncbi:MAG: serine hydrolase [Oscillatoria sp. PMC 1051.18]|nr:serine hydrolase [Oscillatoria sp. PMC 1050.18]MEC5031531.1 serine hydrolase [Oscillatoria sp. PMC 1051.18]
MSAGAAAWDWRGKSQISAIETNKDLLRIGVSNLLKKKLPDSEVVRSRFESRRRTRSKPQSSSDRPLRRPSSGANNGSRRRERQPKSKSPDLLPVPKPKAPRTRPEANNRPPERRRNKQPRRGNKPPRKLSSLLWLYGVRVLILAVGLGAIAGTLLSVVDPSTQISEQNLEKETNQLQASIEPQPSPVLPLSQEITPLKTQLQVMLQQNPQLQPGVFLVDLDTGAYLNWEGSTTFSAASTIKVPILVAFFQDVDAGKIRLDETLTLTPETIATGSGDMQYQAIGTQYTALETATKMITISDNSATNMLIERLGGAIALNQRFQEWGLTATAIRNPLPDIEGTNTTSPEDLAKILARVNKGELISMRSRDRLLEIMKQTENNTLLPQGLGQGATIAHKTGYIGSMLGDVGIVDMPSGKRYLVAIMVSRPDNDPKAKEFIHAISRAAYQYFNQPFSRPNITITPSHAPKSVTARNQNW